MRNGSILHALSQEMLVAAMPAPCLQGLSADENLMLGAKGATHLMLPSSGRLLSLDKALGVGCAVSHLGRRTALFGILISLNLC